MTRNKKIIITLFIIAFLLIGAWLSLDSRTKNSLYRATLCKLIYGKNICNFYEMMDTVSSDPENSDFEKAMQLCREMEDVPKKDSCFEYIAQVVYFYDIGKAKEACGEIKGFKGIHSKEDCYTMVEKSEENKVSEIIFPEVIWSKYINDEFGFSIDIPDKVYGWYSCDPKKVIQVPVKVFEDNENGVVYISQEYYYISEYDSELHKHVGECKKIIYSLELFRNGYRGLKPRLGWAIMIKTVKNEDELDKFIKENYGSGCSAEDKKFWGIDYHQPRVYDIHIGGESDNQETTLGTTSCVEAWTARHKVLYFPEENKVVSVILGQESTFQTNPHLQPYQSYDQKMIDSFRFE